MQDFYIVKNKKHMPIKPIIGEAEAEGCESHGPWLHIMIEFNFRYFRPCIKTQHQHQQTQKRKMRKQSHILNTDNCLKHFSIPK